jgi:hypothetical protein
MMIVLPVAWVSSLSVEVDDDRVGDELQGDIDALPLSTTQDLLLRLADLQMRHALEAEIAQSLLYALVDFLVAVVGRQPELSAVSDGLPYRELGMDQVVLGHVADGTA